MERSRYPERFVRPKRISSTSNELTIHKKANDTFEENAEELIREGKNQKEAYQNKIRHEFFIPKEARWSLLSRASENIGQIIDDVCRLIEKENRDLDGVLTNTKYSSNVFRSLSFFYCMACTNLCERLHSKITVGESRYEGAKKYCTRCEVFFYHNGSFCPSAEWH
jgi:hypothetical protein